VGVFSLDGSVEGSGYGVVAFGYLEGRGSTINNSFGVPGLGLDIDLQSPFGGRGAGLAGYLGGEPLSGTVHCWLRWVWLSSGLQGVGWLVIERERLRETGPLFFATAAHGRPSRYPLAERRKNWTRMNASAARIAAQGTVVTHASNISPTLRHFACRVVTPMPSNDPTLTCVVLTGRLWRLAVVTSAAVTRLAANP
jgi:hypothetical protein